MNLSAGLIALSAQVIVWADHALVSLTGLERFLATPITPNGPSSPRGLTVLGLDRGLCNPFIVLGVQPKASAMAASTQVIVRADSTLIAQANNGTFVTAIADYVVMNL
jgi:hypothetical protein